MGEPPLWGTSERPAPGSAGPFRRRRRSTALGAAASAVKTCGLSLLAGLCIASPTLEGEGVRAYLVASTFIAVVLLGMIGVAGAGGELLARRRSRRQAGVPVLECGRTPWADAPRAFALRPVDGAAVVASGSSPLRPGDPLRVEVRSGAGNAPGSDPQLCLLPGGDPKRPPHLTFVQHGRAMLSSSRDGVQVVDPETLETLRLDRGCAPPRFRFDRATLDVRADLHHLAASERGLLAVFDLRSGALLKTVGKLQAEGEAYLFGFAPGGPHLAVATSARTVEVWDTDLDRVRWSFSHPRAGDRRCAVRDLTFSPDGGLLATSTSGRTAATWVWDLATGERLARLPHRSQALTARFSASGHRLTSWDHWKAGEVRVWDVLDGALLAGCAHPTGVRLAALSPDESLLATADSDEVVRLWRLDGGELLGRLPARGSRQRFPARKLGFTGDGTTLLLVDDDAMTAIPLPRDRRPADRPH